MYIRNLLKAGQFVTLVPIGLPITLQYDMEGQLEQVYLGHGDTRSNVSEKLLPVIMQERNAPIKIPLSGGTSWVMGVLYSGDLFPVSGTLPEAAVAHGLDHYTQCPELYKFYAGNIYSNATQFRGAAATRQWLNGAKFSVLPGFLVPPNMNSMLFKHLLKSAKYEFKSDLVQSYIIHDAKCVDYVNTGIRQVFAGVVSREMSESGEIRATITHKGLPDKLDVSWAAVVNFNIQPNSILVLGAHDRILHVESGDDKRRTPRSTDMVCSVCGKPYSVGRHDTEVVCPDMHCMSRMYPRVVQLLEALQLPVVSYQSFMSAVNNKELLVLADVLGLPQYADLAVDAAASTLLRGAIPYDVCPDSKLLDLFCTRCANKISTIRYYLQHPDAISKDLDIPHVGVARLVEWLSDTSNAVELEALFDANNINVIGVDRLFMGSPILRNKTIMITGKFLHGTSMEVSRILQSYDARVVYDLRGRVDCVVVGDGKEDINSAAIRNAKSNQIPVLSESQFFEQFKIDEDLADHL